MTRGIELITAPADQRRELEKAVEEARAALARGWYYRVHDEAWVYPTSALLPVLRQVEREELDEAGDEDEMDIIRADFAAHYAACEGAPYALVTDYTANGGLNVIGKRTIADAVRDAYPW